MTATSRKPTNLSLDADLLQQARALELNISRAAEAGIAEAIRKEKARLWQAENAGAIHEANDWIERNGLPLKARRLF